MKKLIITIAFVSIASSIFAQSNSFLTFKEKFAGEEDVHCFKTNGLFVRTILGIVGEYEAKRAIRHISKVRLIAVPKTAFETQDVTVRGFKKVLKDDAFEQMIHLRDDGDDITVYASTKHHDEKRYMMLVEADDDVILIELTGYVDQEYIKSLFSASEQKI